jgi:hypothetical protein
VTTDPATANHAPCVRADALDRSVAAGQRAELAFVVEDPDGDEVAVTAVQDGGPPCQLIATPTRCLVDIPADAPAGSRVQIVIQAVDNGTPALTGYARFTLTVEQPRSADEVAE